MSSLVMMKPARPSAVIDGTTYARILTPDPKEAATIPPAGAGITLDFGAPITVDTAFVGYHTATGATPWSVGPNSGTPTDGISASFTPFGFPLAAPGIGTPVHGFVRVDQPVTSRYWQFQFGAQAAAYTVGVIALGRSFQPFYGHELGGGRFITDTGSADRLFGGGFAINEGVVTGGWEWTLGDLNDDELRNLYTNILRQVGNTRTVLTVEDPDQTDGLNERIHWGLLTKIDRYERFAPGASRLSLRIDDWA